MNPSLPKWLTRFATLSGEIYRQLEGRQTLKIVLADKNYFLKRHFGIGWKEIFKNLFQARLPIISAKNEYLALTKLAAAQVSVPEVKLYAKRGFNPAKCFSVIIMEAIEDAISLEDLFKHADVSYSLKRKLIFTVATMASKMHRQGINHRDLYICHFLLKKNSIAAKVPVLYLIDLHRAQCRKVVPKRWLVKDLAGLYFSVMDFNISKRDLYYFLKFYFNKPLKEILTQDAALLEQVQSKAIKLYQKENRFHEKKIPDRVGNDRKEIGRE